MPKLLRIESPPALSHRLGKVLQAYAEAAYPPGGSECGQVARAALMDAAEKILAGADQGLPYVELNKRLRSYFNAAVEYYCQQRENQIWQPLLEQLLRGEPVNDSQIQALEQKND